MHGERFAARVHGYREFGVYGRGKMESLENESKTSSTRSQGNVAGSVVRCKNVRVTVMHSNDRDLSGNYIAVRPLSARNIISRRVVEKIGLPIEADFRGVAIVRVKQLLEMESKDMCLFLLVSLASVQPFDHDRL